MRLAIRFLILTLVLGGPGTDAFAQGTTSAADLARVTLEDLMSIRIISANRKEQRAGEVPAAVFVLTQDDIRRSGIRTLPELFRLVPGMQTSRVNASNWAISVRGFADLFSDKLLVLIDGRSIYNRQFSGVFWDTEDLLVDDIDHIEVIRGSGGAVWGANAVNGVINIVTKSATETKGALVRVGAGTYDRTQASLRYGGSIGNAAYRVSSQWTDRGSSRLDRHTTADDAWHSLSNGMRVDWTRGSNALMVDGSFVTAKTRPGWILFDGPTPGLAPSTSGIADRNTGSILGRWTHTAPGGGSLQVQSFFTRRYLDDVSVDETEYISDIDAQYHTKLGERHDVVLGGGYRRAVDVNRDPKFGYSLSPERTTGVVLNTFAQDEIALGSRVKVTLGAKLEHESSAGWNVQPTGRLMWTLTPSQHVWGAVSRAVRTPSSVDRGIRVNYAVFANEAGMPIVLGLVGNPNYRAETLVSMEAGYRLTVGSTVAFDVSAFRGSYDHLKTNEPLMPIFETQPAPAHLFMATQFDNLLRAQTAGIEIAGHWTPTPSLRLDGSYSGFHLTPTLDAASRDAWAAQFDGNTAAHQWQVHSSVRLGGRSEINVGLYHVGRLGALNAPPATRADANLDVKLTGHLSLVATGQDLLNRGRLEFPSQNTGLRSTSVPRRGALSLIWRY